MCKRTRACSRTHTHTHAHTLKQAHTHNAHRSRYTYFTRINARTFTHTAPLLKLLTVWMGSPLSGLQQFRRKAHTAFNFLQA